MKHILILFSLFVSGISVHSSAQGEKYGPWGGYQFRLGTALYSPLNQYWMKDGSKGSQARSLSLTYDRSMAKNWSMNLTYYTSRVDVNMTGNGNNYTKSILDMNFQVGVRYNYYLSEHVRCFGEMSGGLEYTRAHLADNKLVKLSYQPLHLAYQFGAGIERLIGRHFSVWGKAGYGTMGVINGGVAFQW
ncbi:MAG: hypothetical protein GC180_12115 [Bacteroidetes bacterium]|nr:hypothetical protein [Bacteroidota bacterium]